MIKMFKKKNEKKINCVGYEKKKINETFLFISRFRPTEKKLCQYT